MTVKEFQEKHDYDDEDIDLIKSCCKVFGGKLSKEPYVKQKEDKKIGLHRQTATSNP